jgi:lambda family phage tail tape measure protein
MAENRELALVLKLVADQFQSELKKSGGALGEFNKFISDWKVQLTAAGTALFAIAKSTANYGEELLKTSQKIGIKVEALAGLQHAANLADLSNESLSTGLKKLSVNMVDAARQTGDGEALFRRLGVSATDAAGQLRPTEQVLLDLADVFAHSKDGAGKAEVAVKLFGKAGLDLIPFLNQGKVGINELRAEAERLGLVMSQQDAEAANRFNDELKKLAASLRGVTMAVGKELVPTMTELITLFRTLGVGTGLSAGLGFLHTQFTALNTLFKELKANGQFLFGTGDNAMNLDQLRARIAEIEADAQKKLYDFKHPGVLTPGPAGTAAGSSTPKGEIAVLADQEKLGKALLEIYLANNRAIDIRNKLMSEGADGYRHLLDFQIQEEKNEEDRQERLGRNIVQQTSLEVKIRDEALAKERDGLAQNAQAWIDYHAQVGGSTQLRYDKDLELLTANLTKQLDLTTEETAKLLTAWQEHDSQVAEDILAKTSLTATQRETIELQSLAKIAQANERASDDVVAGWARGMQNYVRQTGNGFNLATDMARQTAQTMEQGFKTFFFDLFEGRVNSLKDVLRSLLDFAKQIFAQIAAQLVTKQILGLATSFSGAGGGAGAQTVLSGPTQAATGGELVRRFAFGGLVPGFGTGDTVPALLTPGEFVLSRRDVSDIKRGIIGGGNSPINIAITVNAGGGSQQSGSGAAPNFAQLARDLSRLVESKLIEEQRPGGLLAGGFA